ncbi:MAG: glycosyltransferase [Candidatus Krumholzibacteriota bacterium]|nr:glycosyltransferase [Candidatus Krumholzibacteriota bacterium]
MTGGDPELVFFGAFDPAYPRNAIIREGWRRTGRRASECRTDVKRKAPTRYPALLWQFLSGNHRGGVIFVPDFRHKDVPLAWLIARLAGRRLVFDPLVSRWETRVLDRGDATAGSMQAGHNRNIDRLSFQLSDLVLADTDAHGNFFAREYGLPDGRVRTLYLGFDDRLFPPAPPPEANGTLRVLFYGSYLPLHGVPTIVEAAAAVANEDIRVTLVGGGQTHDETKRLAERLRAPIRFLDAVPDTALAGLIARADVVLGVFGTTPKASLVVPNKVYQALGVGRAVVTASNPAVGEIFRDGEHLLAVSAGDARALAGALRLLAADRGRARALAEAGGRYVRERFNPGRIADDLSALLREGGIR